MKHEMTCPDCRGLGWYVVEADNDEGHTNERCETCKGEEFIVIEPSPRPWTIHEIQPAHGENVGGLCWQTPEGHLGIYSVGAEPHFEIVCSTDHMEHLIGSGHGGVVAYIPMAHGPAGRMQALLNARLIAEARNAE